MSFYNSLYTNKIYWYILSSWLSGYYVKKCASLAQIGRRSCEIARCRENWRRIARSCSILLDQTDCDQAVRSTWLGHSAPVRPNKCRHALFRTNPLFALSLPPEGTFLCHRETRVSSRQHFISQRARPASQFHFSRPLIVDSLIRASRIIQNAYIWFNTSSC